MKEAEFIAQDREVIDMVNRNPRRKSRVVGMIVPKSDVAALERAEEDLKKLEADKLQLKRLGVAAGRSGLGLMCIGAMANGLMDPGLAAMAALACVAWATFGYRRDGYGKVQGA